MDNDRQLITGLFPSKSDRGPTLQVKLSPEVIEKFRDAFDSIEAPELVIWPAKTPKEHGPTHHLFIGPRPVRVAETGPQGSPGSPKAHWRESESF